jgi:hypothetical protein
MSNLFLFYIHNMKRMILTGILLCLFGTLFSQKYAQTILNFGVGIGPNYGGVGTKTVLGYKNSGLLIGLGTFAFSGFAYEIGAQVSYRWMFANIGYGVYSKAENLLLDKYQMIKGGIFMTGAMINLGKPKKFFLEAGLGYDWGGTYESEGEIKSFNSIDAILGFGVRLMNLKPSAS